MYVHDLWESAGLVDVFFSFIPPFFFLSQGVVITVHCSPKLLGSGDPPVASRVVRTTGASHRAQIMF